jgi:hypothetical protein
MSCNIVLAFAKQELAPVPVLHVHFDVVPRAVCKNEIVANRLVVINRIPIDFRNRFHLTSSASSMSFPLP